MEDSLYGIEAGCRAGLTVIAKREDRFGFSQAEADVIIDQIPDVPEHRRASGALTCGRFVARRLRW